MDKADEFLKNIKTIKQVQYDLLLKTAKNIRQIFLMVESAFLETGFTAKESNEIALMYVARILQSI